MKNTDIIFKWFRSEIGKPPCKGPYFTAQTDIIGGKYYHSLEDLLKIGLSKTTQDKIKSAKPGTEIKINNISLMNDLYVKRLNVEEIDLILEAEKIALELEIINNKIQECIPADLKKSKKEIDKSLKEVRKKLSQKQICF